MCEITHVFRAFTGKLIATSTGFMNWSGVQGASTIWRCRWSAVVNILPSKRTRTHTQNEWYRGAGYSSASAAHLKWLPIYAFHTSFWKHTQQHFVPHMQYTQARLAVLYCKSDYSGPPLWGLGGMRQPALCGQRGLTERQLLSLPDSGQGHGGWTGLWWLNTRNEREF